MSNVHITVAGRRWDALAYHFWGRTDLAKKLREANSHLPYEIRFAPVLPGGVKLIVPDLSAGETVTRVEVPPWRS